MNQSRSVFQWACGVVLVAALVPGCSGSDDVSIEDFPKRLAKVICDQLVGCCRAAAMPLDAGTCNTNASAYFQQAFSEQDRSKVHYDGSAADGCLNAYSQALSGCTLQEADSDALNAACSKVFVGTVPVGGVCKQGAECAPQSGARVSCNFSSDSGLQGICTLDTSSPATAPHGKKGEACAGSCTSDSCDNFPSASGTTTTLCFASEGLYCDLQGTCQPTLADGQACSFDSCGQASYCANQTCAPKKADGASCTGSSECAAHNCVFPSDSASNTGTCGSDSLATAKTCAGNFE